MSVWWLGDLVEPRVAPGLWRVSNASLAPDFISCEPVDGEAQAYACGAGLSFTADELRPCAEVEFTRIMREQRKERP